ncbi:hypothetical protein [Rhizobium leguminosarum]|uniref:hypothetical protein n=1 Tax=Rhizobium leguminosarum TaxID=384 RepID=UPI0005B53839|nr:hypothetical protein [Rhizobium leguminosarum]
MSKLASEDFLEQLHAATANALLKKIESGDATAADIAAAAKFLKDNGISRLLDKSLNDEGEAVTGNIPDPNDDPGDFENVVSLYQ